ncbi:MAG: MerR family transcriptional regulator, partial [Holophagales bacterium]|nr:MerR family transcriptional regulator [Holophagales bacterium]
MRDVKTEMTVGELARRAGLTVRTLHHYHALGLLEPSRRSASGYRLYGEAELARLLEILLLRRLGFSLGQIADALAGAGQELRPSLDLHIEQLRRRIEEEQRLLRRLEAVAERLRRDAELSLDDITDLMEILTMHEKYFTPEQLDTLAERAEEVGAEAIAEAEAEWPKLIARARAALERGDDPTSPAVRELAERWR